MKTFFKILFLLCVLHRPYASFAQAPVLNSYPSAPSVIFLDFDGHTVNGTSWNYNGTIYCGPSNLNSTQVSEIFNRIAEDYRPFNVNVTTDSTKYWSAPATSRMRVVFTITSEWYGRAGGVAYVNSFSWGDNTPCFVFTALLNYNIKNISEAAAHEAGHTLGLSHQAAYDANCGMTSEYNSGKGNGEIGWAPIMGVGYYRNFTVWHKGPNPYGCTSTQSDLDIITGGSNGFGFRIDDHSENIASATPAPFINNQFNVKGVISKTDDKDLFAFTLNSKSIFKLDGVPYNVGTGNTGSDLDMQLELIDAGQNIIGSYNPGHALSSIIDTVLNGGTYFLRVDGMGNQYASEYGSLGSFSLEGRYVPFAPLPLRKLELKGIADGTTHKLAWEIDADEAIVAQDIEVSSNGSAFQNLSAKPAEARQHSYTSSARGAVQYRVKVLFDNGRQYFSNSITLKSNQTFSKPQLITNTIRNHTLMVTCPSTYRYAILDYNGRLLATGVAGRGASGISVATLADGAYVIRFTNGDDQYVEKFVKQ